ncbi:MAG: hypothetical protein ABMA64_25565 [Myxococcota bacterium]
MSEKKFSYEVGQLPSTPPVRQSRLEGRLVGHWTLVIAGSVVDLLLDLRVWTDSEVRLHWSGNQVLEVSIISDHPPGHPEVMAVFFQLFRRAYRAGSIAAIEGVEPGRYDWWFANVG